MDINRTVFLGVGKTLTEKELDSIHHFGYILTEEDEHILRNLKITNVESVSSTPSLLDRIEVEMNKQKGCLNTH